MNLLRFISVASLGWRTAVPPEERLKQLDQLDKWSAEQREFAVAQQHGAHVGPGVHRAREAP